VGRHVCEPAVVEGRQSLVDVGGDGNVQRGVLRKGLVDTCTEEGIDQGGEVRGGQTPKQLGGNGGGGGWHNAVEGDQGNIVVVVAAVRVIDGTVR